jgi:hypothetical protein
LADAIISQGGALVGTGAWFAGKIFGPSVDALGQNLKAHLQSRLPVIFGRAEEIAKNNGVTLAPVKPGLLSRMIVDASFSDDTPEITEWWANLFIQASTDSTEANVYAVFSDIMAVVGPREASVLNSFVDYYRTNTKILIPQDRAKARSNDAVFQETLLFAVLKNHPLSGGTSLEVERHFSDPKIPLPVRTFAWKVPDKQGKELVWRISTMEWYSKNQVPIEILERARVFKFSRLEIPIIADESSWVDLVGLTELGIAFFEACVGEPLEGLK